MGDELVYPTVFAAIVVARESPFLDQVLAAFAALTYPKQRMTVFVHVVAGPSAPRYHQSVDAWAVAVQVRGTAA